MLANTPRLVWAAGTHLAQNRAELSLETYLHRLTNQTFFLSQKWGGFPSLAKRILSITAVLPVHPVPISFFVEEDVSISTGKVQDQPGREQDGEFY
jgi:hypothetical protein